ncbi:MAG: hypothetical protein U0326_07845 [Polyangiales bacterium]
MTGSSGLRTPPGGSGIHQVNSSRSRRIRRGSGTVSTHANAIPVRAALPARATGATPPRSPPSESPTAPMKAIRPA